jgi:predicted RNA-binding Zn-ribbon protein involved in translation (DUF1610 family)
MKTKRNIARILGLGSLLVLAYGFTALLAHAGPSPQFKNSPPAIAAAKEDSKTVKPDANGMACPACKTVAFRDAKWVGPVGKGHIMWFGTGVKHTHTCAHCGGAIKVVRGTTTSSMQPNCPMCGKDAARCSLAVQTPAAKT